MTPEEAFELEETIVAAFKPFMDALGTTMVGLAAWADDNKELFEEISRLLEEKEG